MILLFFYDLSSVHVKCDVVKTRKPMIETHPLPAKSSQQIKHHRSEPKSAPVKLGLSISYLIV